MKNKKGKAKRMVKAGKKHLRCVFNNEELLVLGKELAEHNGALAALENDKSRVVSDFGAKIKAKEADVAIASNKIATGYEFRDVPVTITLNKPAVGKKTVVRDDTGEHVGVEDMSQDELQQQLQLEPKVPEAPATSEPKGKRKFNPVLAPETDVTT